MVYPEKKKKVTLLVFLILWILSDNREKQNTGSLHIGFQYFYMLLHLYPQNNHI